MLNSVKHTPHQAPPVRRSNDGRYIYVGNYLDRDITILRVDDDQIVNTGKSFALPGHPASMRGRTR